MGQAKYTDEDLKRVAGIKDEIFNDQLQPVLEVVTDIQTKLDDKPSREEFNELRGDVRTVKAAVTDTNREVHAIEKRVVKLEAA